MFNSLRIKLTLWYSAILALVLILFAFGFYFLIGQTVKQIADDSLEDASDSLITRIKNDSTQTDQSISEILEDFRFQYTVFAVYDKDKKIIAASPRLQTDQKLKYPTFNISSKEIPAKVLTQVFQNPDTHETFVLKKTNIRIHGNKTNLDDKEIFIATLRPLTNQTELLSNIRFIFLAGIPLALILSSLGGYYLARKSLEPVREMGERASLITSQNLSERLPTGKKRDELEKLADIFNKMLTRLETSFEQQRRFMADASHELRTPLAIMRGEAEVSLQKTNRTEDEYRESLEVIRQEGVRLSHIVEDLFILARADAQQYKLNITTFYLDELINETGRAVRTLVAKKNLDFNLTTDENLIFKADEALIRRLIIILLDNAIKYSLKGGTVRIECIENDLAYQISVSNTGISIPAEEQKKIFERFYRTDKARSHNDDYELGTGAGLGLSMGKWIAKVHQGTLELIKSDESETVFTINLPKVS
jgi:heavy metal sensor kinase